MRQVWKLSPEQNRLSQTEAQDQDKTVVVQVSAVLELMSTICFCK